MYVRGHFLAILLLVLPYSFPSSIAPLKQEYVIGGWIPDTEETFLLQWSPIFEDYLNKVVGQEYEPTIRFRLIPVDFTPENRAIDLINNGEIDFVCE